MTTKDFLEIIEKLHKKAQIAMKQRDISGYMSIFSNDLEYIQKNGDVIDREQLLRDQKKYFSRLVDVKSEYKMLSFERKEDLLEETIEQNTELAIRVFIFFKKKWKVKRRGIYSWTLLSGDEPKIRKVKILEENVG